jgi:quinol monooxygenase YgiN
LALKAHLAAPHMAQFFEDTEELVDDISLSILENA